MRQISQVMFSRFCWMILFCLTAIAINPSFIQAQVLEYEEPIVSEIEFRWYGPETVSRQVIEANIKTAKGQPFSRLKIEQDVRRLMDTGYFLNVAVYEERGTDGMKIRFDLQGKSRVRQVLITGNRIYKEERIRREIKTAEGVTLSERRVHEDALAITDLYQKGGYQDAQVDESIGFDPDTGQSVVTFKITEGVKTKIVNIHFEGASQVSPKVLRSLMKTKPANFWSWLTGAGKLKDEQFDEDLEKIRSYYLSQGYIDMDFVRNEQNNGRGYLLERPKPGQLRVVIFIHEGKQYKVGETSITGNKLFPTSDIQKTLKMTEGRLFTPRALADDIANIRNYYGAKGYPNTDVRAIKSSNPITGRMDIRYEIREGELNYIQKIVIRGNSKTRDRVIRRELAVVPGDVWNTVKVDRSRQRLENLGFFSRVDTVPEPTDIPNHPDLIVDVEEQPTGQVSFGAAFSSVDNLLGFVEVTQGNFDLFGWPNFVGGGQKLRLRTQIGTRRQDFIVSFTEPWFLEQKLSFGVDAFHTRANYYSSLYDERRTGGNLRLEKALGEWWRVNWKYGIESVDLKVDPSASAVLRAEDGRRTKSYTGFGVSHDSRDNVFLTHRGNRTDAYVEYAGGALGGNVDIYKLTLSSTQYFPLILKDHILLVQGNIGVVEKLESSGRVPLFDRFFLGGGNSLRGFDFREVSPRDVQGEPIGGRTYWSTTVEYSFPIVERIRGALFVDAGNVYPKAFSFGPGRNPLPGGGYEDRRFYHLGAGFGFRFNLPYLGALRFDFGFPIISDDVADDGMQFHFNVGYQF